MEEELERLEALKEAKKKLEDEVSNILKDVSEKYSPVKNGDEVLVNGYSHRGKKMLIDVVTFRPCWKGYEFFARGYIFKKDGTLGENRGEWSEVVEWPKK